MLGSCADTPNVRCTLRFQNSACQATCASARSDELRISTRLSFPIAWSTQLGSPFSPPACRAAAEMNSIVPKTLFVESTRNAISDAGTATAAMRLGTATKSTLRINAPAATTSFVSPRSPNLVSSRQTGIRPNVSLKTAGARSLEYGSTSSAATGTSTATELSAGGRGSPRASQTTRARKSAGVTLNINRSSIRSEKCEAKVPAWTTIQKTAAVVTARKARSAGPGAVSRRNARPRRTIRALTGRIPTESDSSPKCHSTHFAAETGP